MGHAVINFTRRGTLKLARCSRQKPMISASRSLSRPQFDKYRDNFRQTGIGHADCYRLLYRVVLEQNRLDLRRGDILAADADHLFDSADQPEITVLADHAEIAAPKPALIVQRFSG